MLIAQVNGLELLPDASEAAWGGVSALLLVAFVLAIAGAIVWVRRAAARRRDLVVRVERLEKSALESRQQ